MKTVSRINKFSNKPCLIKIIAFYGRVTVLNIPLEFYLDSW